MNIDILKKNLFSSTSIDGLIRKSAENILNEMEKSSGFSELLLIILKENLNSYEIKQAAAIRLKNFIKINWIINESNDDKIPNIERNFVRDNIIELQLTSESLVQKQLSEAISIIAKQDFPESWPNLLPQLVDKLSNPNFIIINGVLQICNSLFERYRFESRSDSLWIGIKEVISKLAVPLTQLIQHTISLIQQHLDDKNALSILWSSLLLISKIFYSLNCQDLPEFFEENMRVWMEQFHSILQSNSILVDNSEEPCVIEDTKAEISEILSMYASKYDEEFTEYIKVFVEDIYRMMLATTTNPRYDSLVTAALHFLGIVADKPQHRLTFSSIVDIQQLCQQIIIPNVEFQLSDQEMFEENPEDYIGRDIEGSNALTRRKSSCELVKSLNRFQENKVVVNFGEYIQQLLINYAKNPSNNWKMKDSALFLVTSVASRAETARLGVTETTELVDIKSFYQSHILPELQTTAGHPVIKADCIKYLMTFRGILYPDDLRLAINLVVKFASSESHVVHSYAAAAINKLLMVPETPKSPVAIIRGAHIQNPTTFVASLCATMNIAGSQDNQYTMQAIVRTLSTLQSLSLPAMNHLVPFLAAKLSLVVKTSRRPLFNHFLIEAIALSIRLVCADNNDHVTHFEGLLCPIFNDVLVGDIDEFIPYAFQLFSLMLDHHRAGDVSGPYAELFQFLTHPALWDKSDNIPSLIRLLLSYLERSSGEIIANQVPALLTIFARLNNSRAMDSYGFSLLTAVMLYVPRSRTEAEMRSVWCAIFGRLTRNKTNKYLSGLLLFLSSLVHTGYTSDDVVAMLESIQAGLFRMCLDSAILPTMTGAMMAEGPQRRIIMIGMTRLVTECSVLRTVQYWPLMVAKLSEVLCAWTTATDSTAASDNAHFVDLAEPGQHTSLNQLIFVPKKTVDPCPAIADPRRYFCEKLQEMSVHCGQMFTDLYGALDEDTVLRIKQLMAN